MFALLLPEESSVDRPFPLRSSRAPFAPGSWFSVPLFTVDCRRMLASFPSRLLPLETPRDGDDLCVVEKPEFEGVEVFTTGPLLFERPFIRDDSPDENLFEDRCVLDPEFRFPPPLLNLN